MAELEAGRTRAAGPVANFAFEGALESTRAGGPRGGPGSRCIRAARACGLEYRR